MSHNIEYGVYKEDVNVIREKLSEANDKFRARNSILVKDVRTSEFIGCTTCGSKLKRTYLKSIEYHT